MEAANGKWSSTQSWYYDDPYISNFVDIKIIKLPHQNLGSYFRTKIISDGAKKFHSIYGTNSQIVVLGCGYDTLYWILRDLNITFKSWYDIDKNSVILHKSTVIKKSEIFNPSEGYYLIPIDFEETPNFISLLPNYENLPTLFIDEFSMIYMNQQTTNSMLKTIGSDPNNCFISYGMTLSNDEFGTLVKKTFEEMGIPLKSYDETETVESAVKRLLSFGFGYARAIDCEKGMNKILTAEEKKRISRLELFDDPNQVIYTMRHYLVSVAGCNEFVKMIPIE